MEQLWRSLVETEQSSEQKKEKNKKYVANLNICEKVAAIQKH